MPLTLVDDVYLVTFVGQIFEQVTMSTFYYRVAVIQPPHVPTVTDVYVNMGPHLNTTGGLAPDYRSCCPQNWIQTDIWIQRVWPIRVIKNVMLTPAAQGGGAIATTSNLSGSITRKAETAARTSIGGIRIPNAGGIDAVDGRLSPLMSARYDTLATEMLFTLDLTASCGVVMEPVLFARLPLPVVGVRVAPLFITQTQPTIRSMARRVVGRGV